MILGWLLEFAVSVPLRFANTPLTPEKLPEKTFAGLISITNVCAEVVIVALVPPLLPRPILNELVLTTTCARLAVTITLPVGLLTSIPAPLFTEVTLPAVAVANNSSKLFCTF